MPEEFLCRQRRQISPLKLNKKGKVQIEIILWLLFSIPGLIYSTWWRTCTWFACPDWGSHHIIPLTSPMGREFVAKKR